MGVYHAPVRRDYHALRCFQGYKLRHRRLSCKGLSNCFAINCTCLPPPEHGLERFLPSEPLSSPVKGRVYLPKAGSLFAKGGHKGIKFGIGKG
jgi:hypothetical protein